MSSASPWILGIASSHNGAVCLLHGDEIVAAVQEERLLRQKRARVRAAYGSLAVNYCLQYAGISAGQLDLIVACGQKPLGTPNQRVDLCPLFEGRPVLSISHHLGHAVAAFATSGFQEAAVLVIDGMGSPLEDVPETERAAALDPTPGGFETTSLYHACGNRIIAVEKHFVPEGAWLVRRERRMPSFGSLGGMYGAVGAQIFGDPMDGAGKVMGLAPYGTATIDAAEFFSIEDNRFLFSDRVPERFCHTDRWPLRPTEYQDLAASAQAALERGVAHLVNRTRALTKTSRLCYAGGVTLNSVANEQILRSRCFEDVFLMPAAEDSGTAIGAAYYGLFQLTGRNTCRRLNHDAVGRRYSDAEIDEAVQAAPAIVSSTREDVLEDAVDELCDGKIIGWFNGRSELGPRALGQRSILCDPRRSDMKDALNRRVKHREGFRPFAPVVLLEEARRWFELDGVIDESPAMLRVVPVRRDKLSLVPAIVHVDGTGRVQTVTHAENGRLYTLIRRFHERTGVPMLLNTSFNVAGEPIVETPADALLGMLVSGLDACVVGDRFVRARPGPHSMLDLGIEVIAGSFVALGGRESRADDTLKIWESVALDAAELVDSRYQASGRPYSRIHTSTPWGTAVHFGSSDLVDVLTCASSNSTGNTTALTLLNALRQKLDVTDRAFLRLIPELCRARIIRLRDMEPLAERSNG
jgi:carbamoyltransferase